MSAWQPIETCPREGEFLAYDPTAKKYDVCEWRGHMRDWGVVSAVQSDGEYGPDDDEFQGQRATLWMPLPPIDPPYTEPRRPFLELD